ncbi:Proliferation-associated protein 2G4 [Coemansia spiralis]|uniref:Proliferation-associated protein 2G4 n=1 Tax=Coemansia spiralis TaxID=417178 RepID=A0A9W8KVR4_9FUNG|nr:Proliferation-associated protein 2G4 [Coemansia spiralis]
MSSGIDTKYYSSSAIVGIVLKLVLGVAVPGMSVAAVCSYGDSLVETYTKSVYRKEESIERGASVPTTVSVNNTIQNYSPPLSDDYVLQDGDVVKIEIGVHIDGYIASAAHTVIATNSPSVTITDRRADVISAAYYASEVAVRMIRPGQSPRNLVKAIGLVASGFNCTVAEETFTCQINRFVLSGKNTFANRFNPDLFAPDVTFETGEIYTVDCTLSTGDGVARSSNNDSAIFQRDVNRQYSLKLRTSRTLFTEICKRYSVFPFLMRNVVGDNQTLKAGVSECVRSQLLVPFAVTVDKTARNTFVSQFKATVHCNCTGPVRITSGLPLPNVKSSIEIPETSEIGQILALDYKQARLPELPRIKTAVNAPMPTQIVAAAEGANAMDLS